MKVTAISVNGEVKSASGVQKASQAVVTCKASKLSEEISYAKSEIKFKL
jgi:hypothetical protein